MKIQKITKGLDRHTWDLEVPEGHEFLLGNGVVTHNTAQILGNNECFEPFTTNIGTRRVLSGDFATINKHLVKDLIDLNLWDDDMRINIIHNNGSIQDIDSIPSDIKELYKTVWEMKMSNIIDMSIDRGPFIDQSQSLNLFMDPVNYGKLTSAHFKAWNGGLKTGMYYLRTKPAVGAIKTLGVEKVNIETIMEELTCSIDNPEDCIACSS